MLFTFIRTAHPFISLRGNTLLPRMSIYNCDHLLLLRLLLMRSGLLLMSAGGILMTCGHLLMRWWSYLLLMQVGVVELSIINASGRDYLLLMQVGVAHY